MWPVLAGTKPWNIRYTGCAGTISRKMFQHLIRALISFCRRTSLTFSMTSRLQASQHRTSTSAQMRYTSVVFLVNKISGHTCLSCANSQMIRLRDARCQKIVSASSSNLPKAILSRSIGSKLSSSSKKWRRRLAWTVCDSSSGSSIKTSVATFRDSGSIQALCREWKTWFRRITRSS